jgi:hypothetical protein
MRDPEQAVIVRDADDGTWVGVPCGPTDSATDALALSRDGRRLVYLSRSLSRPGEDRLAVRTLADGAEARFSAQAEGEDWRAAFSHDGHFLAVLSTDHERKAADGSVSDLVIVSVIDLATGIRRRLWSGPGRAPAERAVSWSPDGRFIEVFHEDVDERFAVTVLDTSNGGLVSRFIEREVLGCPQGAWFSDHELVTFPEFYGDAVPPTLIVDVVTGVTGRPDTGDLPHGCRGIAGSRIVGVFAPHAIGTADLDGGNPRLLLTHDPMTQVQVVDVAPDAAPLP